MNITKYEHACLVLEQDGSRVVIDPGEFSKTIGLPENLVAIVVTHAHKDHFDNNNVVALAAAFPAAPIYSIQAVADALPGLNVQVVHGGDTKQAGPFEFAFVGNDHALIHSSIAKVDNVGVAINGSFYYGGDSFAIPDGMHIQTLALPIWAPWLKLGEAMDFLQAVKPTRAFPTHNGSLTQSGETLEDTIVSAFARDLGVDYTFIKPGGSLSV